MKTLFLILSLGLAFAVHAESKADITAEEIMQCVRSNFPDSVSVRKVTLTTVDQTGQSTKMIGRVYGKMEKQEDGKSLMRGMLSIDAPASLRGTAYLVRETDDYLRDGMFVYLPAVGRVRRISGDFADRPLMATEFSYFEFKQMVNAFGDLTATLQRSESVGGRAAYVMKLKPLPALETRYDAVNAWVDQQTCLIMAAEFLEDGKVLKRMTSPSTAISKAGDHMYLKEVQMTDVRTTAKTIIYIDEVTMDDEPSSLRFSPKSFFLTK